MYINIQLPVNCIFDRSDNTNFSETPLMKQYFHFKEKYKDSLVLFQVGGFYQLYFNDAEVASEILNLKLTGKDIGKGTRIPMCGVPKRFVDERLKILRDSGYKAVVCSQTEKHDEKGMLEREITCVSEPEEKKDLTAAWEEYMDTHTFLREENVSEESRTKDLLKELKKLELDNMTPMEALQLLNDWRKKYV